MAEESDTELFRDKLGGELRAFLFGKCHELLVNGYDSSEQSLARGLKLASKGFVSDGSGLKESYENLYFDCVYYLKYGLGYACEYVFLYESIFEDMKARNASIGDDEVLRVTSIGSGGGLDKWALLYAAADYVPHDSSSYRNNLLYEGVDQAKWALNLSQFDCYFTTGISNGKGGVFFNNKPCDLYLEESNQNPHLVDIYFFPRMLSELDDKSMNCLAAMLQRAICGQIEKGQECIYIAIAHSSRSPEYSVRASRNSQVKLLGELDKLYAVIDLFDWFKRSNERDGRFKWMEQLERVDAPVDGDDEPHGASYGFSTVPGKDPEQRPYCDRVSLPADGRTSRTFEYPWKKSKYPEIKDLMDSTLAVRCKRLNPECGKGDPNCSECKLSQLPLKTMSLTNFSIFRIERRGKD